MTFGFGVFIRAPLCSVVFIFRLGNRWRLATGEGGAAWTRARALTSVPAFQTRVGFSQEKAPFLPGSSLYAPGMAPGRRSVAALHRRLFRVTARGSPLCQGAVLSARGQSSLPGDSPCFRLAAAAQCPGEKRRGGSLVRGFRAVPGRFCARHKAAGVPASESPGARSARPVLATKINTAERKRLRSPWAAGGGGQFSRGDEKRVWSRGSDSRAFCVHLPPAGP